MRIALIGQPNCGKSTLFNQVAGFRVETGNFHGTTVTFTESKVRVVGEVVQLVDLPGTYTLSGSNPAEYETNLYLLSNHVDVIINVIDASHLAQGLELTLELLKLNRPMIVAMNMMDEAKRMGLKIDGPGLQQVLGLPVMPLIASRGQGILALFKEALKLTQHPTSSNLKLNDLDDLRRHKLASELASTTIHHGERRFTWRDRLDDILLHPVFGYITLFGILFLFFQIVYFIGSAVEGPMLALFDQLAVIIFQYIDAKLLVGELIFGLLQGISGGLAIALPYLIPFLLGLGLLEDIGYLPRVAFLMDSLMHRFGLHGKAIVPLILGYGCNVPAVMSTRILEERQDRFLAAALAVLVPCAARLAVIFGLVAYYMGPMWALGIYLYNLITIALMGRLLSQFLPDQTPGLILEMPVYRLPTFKTVMNKAWFRVKEFLVEAWPLLIAGSVLLSVLNYFNLSVILNWILYPITWLLNLPAETGVPLIFGVLRKELSLIMLRQALGGVDFASVLSQLQMLTFTVFVVFYIPCLPTLAAIRREFGTRSMFSIAIFTIFVALVSAIIARAVGFMILS